MYYTEKECRNERKPTKTAKSVKYLTVKSSCSLKSHIVNKHYPNVVFIQIRPSAQDTYNQIRSYAYDISVIL